MLLLVLNLVLTSFLTGLIWTVQAAHYALFQHIERGCWINYHQQHVRKITFVVAPMMLLEFLAAIALCIFPSPVSQVHAIALLAPIAVAWLSTAFLQIPLHNALGREHSLDNMRKLVRSNWLRTIAWSGRCVWLSALLIHSMRNIA